MEVTSPSPDHEDRVKLLEIFPEEIWLKIFDHVREPTDLLNCVEASQYFKEQVETKKNIYLLPKVLQILDENDYLKSKMAKELLSCRLVCEGWKNGINQFLENRLHHSDFSKDKWSVSCRDEIWTFGSQKKRAFSDISLQIKFDLYRNEIGVLETDMIDEMQKPFYQTHCPFPSRHLKLYDDGMLRIPSFQSSISYTFPGQPSLKTRSEVAIRKILESVGHHFWHLEFSSALNRDPVFVYELLVKYLKLLPNLKSLYVNGTGTERNMRTVIEYFSGDFIPCPNLKNLELFSAISVNELVLNQIWGSSQVKILEICRVDSNGQLQTELLENPEELVLDIWSDRKFRNMRSNWKLKLLRLNFDNVTQKLLCWSDIFLKLESYKETLEQLRLELPTELENDEKHQIWTDSKRLLNLPKLKTLELKISNFCTFNFLKGLESLEYLYVGIQHKDYNIVKGTKPQEIFRRVLGYKIFDDLPSLMEIGIKIQAIGYTTERVTIKREFKGDTCFVAERVRWPLAF